MILLATRQSVLERAGGVCECCMQRIDTLELHHIHYEVNVHGKFYSVKGRETPDDLEALCRDCHYARHRDINGDFWLLQEEKEAYWSTYYEAEERF